MRPSWDFHTGKALEGCARPDALALTVWESSYAALCLVTVVAGGGRPLHHQADGPLDLAETFDGYVLEVRAGADAESVAAAYLPRNVTPRRKRLIGTLLTVAARARDQDDAARRLLALCHHSGARSLDARDDVVPLDTDRETGLQARWRESLLDGAWLIGLRGAKRCLGCEHPLSSDQLGGRRIRRKVGPDRPGGRRVDYCSACTTTRLSAGGGPLPSLAEAMGPTHNERIRTVLDAAEPAILP